MTTHLPLLALIVYVVAARDSRAAVPVLLVTLLATGVGTTLAVWALHQLLRPILLAGRALAAYLDDETALVLPTRYGDAAGVLLRNVVLTIQTFDAQRRHLEQQAGVDVLTGVLTRRAAEARLRRVTELVAQDGRAVCVALVDVDHFKQINDRFGHGAGDRVLAEFGQTLREGLRPTDWVGRWGGDEFVVVLEAPLAASVAVLERLRAAVVIRPTMSGAPAPAATLSIGVARMEAGDDVVQALHRADVALYRAKQAGRNRVVAGAELAHRQDHVGEQSLPTH